MTACSAVVYDGFSFRGRSCARAGVVHEDGKDWCKQHAPSATKARQEANNAKYEEKWAKEAAANKLRNAAPALAEALRALVANVLDYEKVNNLAPNPGRKYCWDSVERAVDILRAAGVEP